MRHQICVTLDEETLVKIREKLRDIRFRSKSHFVEVAVEEFLKVEE